MKTAFLIGDKIYLRALQKSDAATCGEFINDPDVWRTLDTCRPKNLMAEEEWIAGQCGDPTTITLGIALKENDRLIGTTDLRAIHAINRCATFGLMVGAKDQWRNGHGTEATRMMVAYGFQTLNLNRIDLRVYETNPHAMRAYEKAGFVREGVMRQAVFRDGRYVDVIMMAVLRE